MTKTKHEMREAVIKRLKEHRSFPDYYRELIKTIVGDDLDELTSDECTGRIIDLLADDESYEDDAYAKGPRDADGLMWFRGDMSDSTWGVIEGVVYDCTRREWLVRGHDISAPWMSADSIKHAPMRTATKRENDLIRLLKDAAKEYQREHAEVEWQKELYRSLSDHAFSDMVLLPRDADGEVVHVGDEMVVGDYGYRFIVAGVGLADRTDVLFETDGDKSDCFPAKVCRHYRPPTIEDVLREFAEKVTDSQIPGTHPTYEEAIAEYTAKLQVKEDE
jgi:hypothetical protein